MDKISKTIRSLNTSDAKRLINVMKLLLKDDLKSLDVKKLKGYKNIFRVRVGQYRIIYEKNDVDRILFIRHRNDKTYKNF